MHFSGKLVRKTPKRPELHTGGWRVVVTSHGLGLQHGPRVTLRTPDLVRSSPNAKSGPRRGGAGRSPRRVRGWGGRTLWKGGALIISARVHFCKKMDSSVP